MADPKTMLNRVQGDDFLAEDDPLAELARLAGHSRAAAPIKAQPVRQEPEFDLEDELLREFALYDAPKIDLAEIRRPAAPVLPPEPVIQPAVAFELSAEAFEPQVEPVEADLPFDINVALEEELVRQLDPFAAPSLVNLEEPVAVVAAPDEVDDSPVYAPTLDDDAALAPVVAGVEAETFPEPMPLDDVFSESVFAEEAIAPVEEPVFVAGADAVGDVPGAKQDVAEESQDDIWALLAGNDRPVLDEAPPVDASGVAFDPEAAFAATVARLDHTHDHDDHGEHHGHDHVGWSDVVLDDRSVAEAWLPESEPDTGSITQGEDWHTEDLRLAEVWPEGDVAGSEDHAVAALSNELAVEDATVVVVPVALDAEPEALSEPYEAQPVDPVLLDSLLSEPEDLKPQTHEREDANVALVAPVAPRVPVAAPADQARNWQFSRSTPQQQRPFTVDDLLAEVERFPMPSVGEDWNRTEGSRAAEKMPVIEPFADHADVSAASEPTVMSAPAQAEDFIGDMTPVDAASGTRQALPVIADPFDDAVFEAELGEITLDLSDLDVSDESSRPVAGARYEPELTVPVADALDQMAREPVIDRWSEPAAPAYAAAPTDLSSLPFDPTQISDTEDSVEAVNELDVPDLPVDQEEVRPQAPEFDIDIDTEIARIYNMSPQVSEDRIADRQVATNPAPGAYLANDPIDAFEKALEDDFRRTMDPAISGQAGPDKHPLVPELNQMSDLEPPRSRAPLLAGVSIAAILLLGGVGAYAWFFADGSLPGTSTEPRIILADKSPVKVVPENPGGTTVPNQDKAVYDRVTGKDQEQPKQENLVSSTEEPVDVVQKTLVPDAMPMDPDSLAGTPTDETSDPRLLPESVTDPDATAEDANAAKPANALPGVQPRKVRTMIVKPDGTLVPREETELVPATDAKPEDAADIKAPVVEETAQADVPERLPGTEADDAAKATETVSRDVADVPLPDAKPVDETAAKPVETAVAATTAEPAKVETPEETAAASDADANQAALQAAAETEVVAAEATPVEPPVRVVKTKTITPVPENRPADQDVNVVSTVTEQGNVRPGDQPTEVAAVDQAAAEQPAAQPVPAGTYVIQIASLPSEADAQRSYEKLSAKFSGVIGGRGVDIRKAEISGKGTFYRVRIPAGTKAEAQALCQKYKSAGGSCLVSK